MSVAGTTIGREQRPWLVEVDGYRVEIELAPAHLLVMMNDDSPGMIGQVGMLFGAESVNISNMSVSRSGPGRGAVMVLAVDAEPERGGARAAAGPRGHPPRAAGHGERENLSATVV